MILYGVCNHTVENVMDWQRKKYLPILSMSDIEKGKTLILTDAGLLFSNLRVFNKLPNTCILFTGPLRLAALAGAYNLDLTLEHTPPFYGIKIRSELSQEVWNAGQHSKISIQPIDYTQAIISHVESTSILTDFMTIVYTLPSATHQKPIKTLLLHWLYFGGTDSYLDKLLQRIGSVLTMSSKVIDRIKSLLLSPISARIRKALKLVRKGADVVKVADANSVSAYDMRYILSIVNDKNITDFERSLISAMKREFA